jgi:hypothetical protein
MRQQTLKNRKEFILASLRNALIVDFVRQRRFKIVESLRFARGEASGPTPCSDRLRDWVHPRETLVDPRCFIS